MHMFSVNGALVAIEADTAPFNRTCNERMLCGRSFSQWSADLLGCNLSALHQHIPCPSRLICSLAGSLVAQMPPRLDAASAATTEQMWFRRLLFLLWKGNCVSGCPSSLASLCLTHPPSAHLASTCSFSLLLLFWCPTDGGVGMCEQEGAYWSA